MKRIWVVVAAVCLLPVRARGDVESDRKQYIEEIERLLDGIADDLSRVASDSGTSYVDYAISKAEQVKDKAQRLSNVKGDDDKARRYADYYPGYADKFREYARYLRSLKEGQRSLDEVPRRCEDKTKELVAKMRAYTDSGDPRGMDEVPKLAREYGRVGKDAIEQSERKKYEMYQWYDRADDFSESDGKWSNVRSNLASSARSVWEYFQQRYERVKHEDVCGDLSKEERNPLVEQEMKKLLEGKRGIEMIYNALDSQLGEMASLLNDLEGDSSTSDIDSAERKADDVERNVEQLDRIKGQDGEARRRVDLYRNILRAYRQASKHLRTLKQGQYLVDRAPEKCGEAERNLDDFIRKYTDRGDTAGVKLIPAKARAIGEGIKAALQKADEQHRLMETEKNEALRFDPGEGRWREVRSNMKESTEAIWDYWKRAWQTSHEKCDELAKGDEHRNVVRALRDLGNIGSNAERELRAAKDDHRKWYGELKELREWYKQDTSSVRQLFCSIEESGGDTDLGDAYAAKLAEIADRMRNRLAPKWKDLGNGASSLVARLQKLEQVQDEDVRTESRRLIDKINRTMTSVQNVLDGELNGANDPEVRAQIEVGRNEHKRIQRDSGKCHEHEITVPGKGVRIDCVYVSSGTCTIYEIKPNNSEAIARGKKQAGEYREAVQSYFREHKDDLKKKFTDEMEIFLKCIDDGTISLAIDVRAYDFCPADGKLFHDFVVPSE